MLSRKVFIAVLIFTGSVLIAILCVKNIYKFKFDSKDANLSLKIAHECGLLTPQRHEPCFNSRILAEVEKNPSQTDHIFSGLWQMAIEGELNDDPRIFSDIAHAAGMMLAEKNIPLSEAFSFCGKTFKQGCMHGFIMEYIDKKYPKDIDIVSFKKICKSLDDDLSYQNCTHGIGHELAAKVKKDLPVVLNLCKSFSPRADAQWACESGVLMEFTKGTAGSGMHSDLPVGRQDLPCISLPEGYKKVCFASEGSYRQYNPGHESFPVTYKFCASIQKPYSFDCMLGVSERAILATAENAEHVEGFCKDLSMAEGKECLDSLIQVSKTQFDNVNLTSKLQEYQKLKFISHS